MSEYVMVKLELIDNLIGAACAAHNLLDDVHCYDTDVYHNLGEAIDNIEIEEIKNED